VSRHDAIRREREGRAARSRNDGARERTGKRQRPCPRCRALVSLSRKRCPTCSADLQRRVWTLTTVRIRALRALAHTRKGLDDETFRDRLAQLGVASTKDLTRELYHTFRAGLLALPDAPAWRERQAGANKDEPHE